MLAFGVATLAVFAVMWIRLPDQSKETFDWFQRLTLLAIAAVPVWLLYRIGTLRVRAADTGLIIRNLTRTSNWRWDQVTAMRFDPGDAWLQVFDDAGQRTGVLAIQRTDGARADRAARELSAYAHSHGAGPQHRRADRD